MNLLFLIGTYSDYGGTEKITTVLANAWHQRGCRVVVAAFRGEVQPTKLGLSPEVKCCSLGSDPESRLREIIREEKIEVIFNQWCLPFHTTRIINLARKGTKARLISVLHGVPDKSKKVIVAEDAVKAAHGLRKIVAQLKLLAIHTVIKASIRYVYRHSDAYVVLSKGFIPAFQKYTGIKNTTKLFAIGNPVTIGKVEKVERVERVEREDKDSTVQPSTSNLQPKEVMVRGECEPRRTILYVGRMDKENKRVNRIVEAWASIYADYPDWDLVLVGDGPHREELQTWVREHHVERVTFTGRVKEDPIEYYRKAAIFMLTSDLEGFGLVLLEAMSFGVVPIVYNSYASASEIVDDGINGILTPMPFSPNKTAKALRTIIENDKLRNKMSRAAIEKSNAFSLNSIMCKWTQLITQL